VSEFYSEKSIEPGILADFCKVRFNWWYSEGKALRDKALAWFQSYSWRESTEGVLVSGVPWWQSREHPGEIDGGVV
jgi:hypothetical protein